MIIQIGDLIKVEITCGFFKRCGRCKKTKFRSHFYKCDIKFQSHGGSRCKECNNARNRIRWHNPEYRQKMSKWMKEWRVKYNGI